MTNYLNKYAKNDKLKNSFDTYRNKATNHKATIQKIVPIYKLMSMSKSV